jgi:AraC family transcriptional regulator
MTLERARSNALHSGSSMRPANPAAASNEISAYRDDLPSQLQSFITRAKALIESDHEAARRCLDHASALLHSGTRSSRSEARMIGRPFWQGGLAPWQTQRAVAYIEAHLESKLSAPELAQVVGFTRSHFSSAFKQSVGLPPMAYVATRRVERAKAMITSSGKKLADIASACGFVDQSHLTKSFRRRFGIAPAAWRRIVTAPAK